MALLTLNFESQALGSNSTVTVILPNKPRRTTPAEFYGAGRRYKVLWLLHGTFGDATDWLRKSCIELYACEHDLAVVMPSAMNSDYANWPGFGTGFEMYDFLFEELMPLVYGWFPISEKREDNFIAGLSMGGYGAMLYALTCPEKFCAAASFSYPVMPGPYGSDMAPASRPGPFSQLRLDNQVANAGGIEAYQNSPQNLWKILEDADFSRLPELYFCCGTEDFLYPNFASFCAYAQRKGWNIRFEKMEGFGHEWRLWDRAIEQQILRWLGDDRSAGNPF